MRLGKAIFCFAGLLLMLGLGATSLQILGPVSATLSSNQSVYLGKVGPGESFYVLANPNATSLNGNFVNLGWNELKAVSLPPGWSAQASPLYENPMKMKVTVSPNASYGRYTLGIRSINVQNYSGLGNLTFYGYVNVTPDVFAVTVSPLQVRSGAGSPANISVTINNTGISDDPFTITASGLPAWNFSDEVISLHSTVNTFEYPVFENEPGVYNFNLTVYSATSRQISKTFPIRFIVNEDLLYDYEAVGNGIGLSPVIYEPAYAFMSLLGYLYKLVAH